MNNNNGPAYSECLIPSISKVGRSRTIFFSVKKNIFIPTSQVSSRIFVTWHIPVLNIGPIENNRCIINIAYSDKCGYYFTWFNIYYSTPRCSVKENWSEKMRTSKFLHARQNEDSWEKKKIILRSWIDALLMHSYRNFLLSQRNNT